MQPVTTSLWPDGDKLTLHIIAFELILFHHKTGLKSTAGIPGDKCPVTREIIYIIMKIGYNEKDYL
ncbi:MAG TPA: hypothetical protein DD640_00735 [Clostridiales bacterium]|nr:hypothetical protein [Clostridiales bacterium]